MTSVTLPSNSGPMHGVFTAVTEESNTSEHDFESTRPTKRCLIAPLNDSCKKRRKQSTPIRISAAESETAPAEGKPVLSPEPDLRCPVCQYVFSSQENLENHVAHEHANVECKKEPEDPVPQSTDYGETPTELTVPKTEMPWMGDLQNKEWINPLMPFNPAANPMFMPLPIPSRQPIRIFNPDAYCELCNKEFCNKYFLKTHKANKHGIYSDPISSESTETSGNVPSFSIANKLTTSVPSGEAATDNKAQVTNPFSDIFPNQFLNKMFPKMSKHNMIGLYPLENGECSKTSMPNGMMNNENDRPQLEDIGEESSSPPVVQFDSTSFKDSKVEQETMYTQPSKLSPEQQRELDLSNRLRNIGVMNPKAFCEICCKEYCNKYFLRTHKMKRHGIYIPDEPKDKDMKMDSMWLQNIQTSPLNLIMSEQNINSASYADRKTSSPPEISCEQCGIKFQNASLAQLHNVTVHGKAPTSLDSSDSNTEGRKLIDGDKLPSNTDTISEDLQKLQTMILQLNDLDVKMTTSCNTCNKDFENKYYLHMHMATEHGLLLNEIPEADKSTDNDSSSNNNTMCELCGKDLPNVEEMKKHLNEFHGQMLNNPDVKDEFTAPEKTVNKTPVSSGQITERRSSMSLTPTSSYCDICNKELCNKYFMKTHMQRMHGIEIENGAQIGGVVCDICNKELCSKYFLRVHKHNTHGIVEYGTSLLQPRKDDPPHAPESDPALKPADLSDLNHRYYNHFTEVCTICNRRFRSTKWLKAHLLSDHGQTGADKWAELEQQLQQTVGHSSKSASIAKSNNSESTSPTLKIPNGGQDTQKSGIQNVLSSLLGADETNVKNYCCSFCPFTTPVLPFLFVHERSHTMQPTESNATTQFKCPVCSQTFPQAELFQHHVITQHPVFPPPPFFNGNENQTEAVKESPDIVEDPEDSGSSTDLSRKPMSKLKKSSRTNKPNKFELPSELSQTLKDVAKKCQLTATYAIPQTGEDASPPSYAMQAFLLDDTASERRFIPSLVFLPVLQKQSGPMNVTFTLTPA